VARHGNAGGPHSIGSLLRRRTAPLAAARAIVDIG
jgi:hypothetical protein